MDSVPGIVLEKNYVDKEAVLIDRLVVSAKQGQWTNVWEILGPPENPIYERIFNVIPENRRWGVLHQAVYWNDKDVLQKLLKYEACDSNIRAKQCMSECGETTRMNALEIAESYGYREMAAVLSQHRNRIQDVPTFESYENFTQSDGLGLLSVTLAAYKKTFHPSPIHPSTSITAILGGIFKDITTSDERRKAIQDKVSDSVYVVCSEQSDKIKSSETCEEFFSNVISTYTKEENQMYTFLNMAFRRQKDSYYRPSGDDLALGPYAVIYQMLLLYWPALKRERKTTYRRMLLTKEDLQKYHVGKRIVWQSVVSSSIDRDSALPFPTCGPQGDQAVVFTIDNSAESSWRPRNIEPFETYMKQERTYPAGAKFKITGFTKHENDVHIALELLQT